MVKQFKSMLKFIAVVFVLGIIMSGCNGGSSSSSSGGNATPNSNTPSALGTLTYNANSVAINTGATNQVTLTLNPVNNLSIAAVLVTFSSDNEAIAIVTSSFCILGNQYGIQQTCNVTIRGQGAGTANITASALGFNSPVTTVTVANSSVPSYGSLSFSPNPATLQQGGSATVNLILNNSSGVNGESVVVTSSPAGLTLGNGGNCLVSSPTGIDQQANVCPIQISANSGTSYTLTATSQPGGSGTATGTVNITQNSVPGFLQFNKSVTLTAAGIAEPVVLTLESSSGVAQFNASIGITNGFATLSSSSCPLSSTSTSCTLWITPGTNAGSGSITASATGYLATTGYTVIANPTPYLTIDPATESIATGESGSALVTINNPATSTNLTPSVSIQSGSSATATILPAGCTLTYYNRSCTINILAGGLPGTTVFQVSAGSLTSVTNTATITSSTPVAAVLTFTPGTIPVYINGTATTYLTLVSGNGGPVTFTAANPSVITSESMGACTLINPGNRCLVTLTAGPTANSSYLTAAIGTSTATALVNVQATQTAGSLVFLPNTFNMSSTNGFTNSNVLTLVGNVGPESNQYYVTLSTSGNDGVGIVGPNIGYYCLSNESPAITVKYVTQNSPAQGAQTQIIPQMNPGVATPCQSASNYASVALGTATATIVNPTPVARVFTVVNKCNYTVYPAFSGGGFGDGNACPSGSNPKDGQCWWTNLQPATTAGYVLTQGQSTTFTIPATSYDSTTDFQWNGNMTGRTGCTESGACKIGPCTGFTDPSIGTTSGYLCAVTHGFTGVVSEAEFTIQSASDDHYDVSNISGIGVPISMASSVQYNDVTGPYTCGTAGAPYPQQTSFTISDIGNQSLLAANWTPSITESIYSPQVPNGTPPASFNYIDGSVLSNPPCGPNYSCSNVESACGYTFDSITYGFFQPGESYVFSCGPRLGYISGAQIFQANSNLNPESGTPNFAPFAFASTSPTPGTLYQNWVFYNCPGPGASVPPGLNSPYQLATESPNSTCGGGGNPPPNFNWGIGTGSTQVATPDTPTRFDNPVWDAEVYPRIVWIAQACPTCYAYQYDDKVGSFVCHNSVSGTNPANNVNYTITFCPENQ